MKKALFLHGFLGNAEDMEPFFLEGYKNVSLNLKKLLHDRVAIEDFGKNLEDFDLAIGYSFGGRVLSLLNENYPNKFYKKIYVSSRHTAYSKKELFKRDKLQKELLDIINLQGVEAFYDYWEKLSLFNEHKQSDFREKFNIKEIRWTKKEIEYYLNKLFTVEFPSLNKDKQAYYFYGDQDQKYSKEGARLKDYFHERCVKGVGHRLLFEDVERFKLEIKKVLKE